MSTCLKSYYRRYQGVLACESGGTMRVLACNLTLGGTRQVLACESGGTIRVLALKLTIGGTRGYLPVSQEVLREYLPVILL